jgi:hypothetical protein
MTDKGPIEASALAGSAIAIGLLDLLRTKGIISKDDVLTILKEAQSGLKNSPSTIDGAKMVGAIYERNTKSQ